MTVDWRVIVVFDPDHQGHDFAYTVGLHDHGLPELFLWARPTDGDDPGADWMLGDLDLAHRLNELGSQLVEGTLAPGASVDVEYDGGLTRAEMILRQPVAAQGGDLELVHDAPDAMVCEIRWSLHQQPIGPRRELTDDEVDEARMRLAAFISDAGAGSVTFPASARFGPLTPLVEAMRMKVRTLDDHRVNRLIAAAMLPHLLDAELSRLAQAARRAGLVDEIEEAFADATVDARMLADRVFTDPEFATAATELFATIFGAAYGNELVRHELPGPPTASSEVLWALLDPDGRRTQRFVDRICAADPAIAQVFEQPDFARLAALVDGLEEQTIADLDELWVHAAVAGHGSGLWLMPWLLRPTETHDVLMSAGLALAVAGGMALWVPISEDVALDHHEVIHRITAGVRALAPLRQAS